MAKSTLAAALASTVFVALFLPFSVYFTFLTSQSAWNQIQTQRGRSSSNPKTKKLNSSVRITLALTVLSSVSFTIGQVILLIWMGFVINALITTDKSSIYDLNPDRLWHLLLITLQAPFVIGAYIGLLCVCFNRLKTTFDCTQYSLSENEERIGKTTVILMFLLLLGLIYVFIFEDDSYTAIVMGLFVISFLLSSLTISWIFFSRSRQLSLNLTTVNAATPTERDSSQSSINHVNCDFSNDNPSQKNALMEASLRLCILSSMVSVTSLIGFGSMMISRFVRNSPFRLMTVLMNDLDFVVNVFSLLCTFKRMDHWYQWVYGPIHQYCWNQLCRL